MYAENLSQFLNRFCGCSTIFGNDYVAFQIQAIYKQWRVRGNNNLLLLSGLAQRVSEGMDCSWVQMRLRLLYGQDELTRSRGLARVVLHHRQGREALDAVTLKNEIRCDTVIHNDGDTPGHCPILFMLDRHTFNLGKQTL